jgi:hypothetical protein
MSFLRAWRGMVRRSAPRGKHSRRLAVEALEDRTLPSTLTVLTNADSGDGSLRAVIAAAGDGDTINFDRHLRGATITLTSGELAITKSLGIEGLGADRLTVSGNHASRVFNISGGVTVTIAGLTITDGLALGAPGNGGGINNTGGTLTLTHDVLSNNQAVGMPGQNGSGGALRNVSGGHVTVTDCLFSRNHAVAGTGAVAFGGAIQNNASSLTVSDSSFVGNQAIGADGGSNADGGGISALNGSSVVIGHSTFTENEAIAGDGGIVSGTNTIIGFGHGGGIYSTGESTLTVEDSTFTGNQAVGGNGGSGGGGVATGFYTVDAGSGGGIFSEGTLVLSDSALTGNQSLGEATPRAAPRASARSAGRGAGAWRISGRPRLQTARSRTTRPGEAAATPAVATSAKSAQPSAAGSHSPPYRVTTLP